MPHDSHNHLHLLPFLAGMTTQADTVLKSIPYVYKVVLTLSMCIAAFYSIKTDIALIQSQNANAALERREFKDFMIMSRSNLCTEGSCNSIRARIRDLESLHMKNGKKE